MRKISFTLVLLFFFSVDLQAQGEYKQSSLRKPRYLISFKQFKKLTPKLRAEYLLAFRKFLLAMEKSQFPRYSLDQKMWSMLVPEAYAVKVEDKFCNFAGFISNYDRAPNAEGTDVDTCWSKYIKSPSFKSLQEHCLSQPKTIACNPAFFGYSSESKPHCVKKDDDTTVACAKASGGDDPEKLEKLAEDIAKNLTDEKWIEETSEVVDYCRTNSSRRDCKALIARLNELNTRIPVARKKAADAIAAAARANQENPYCNIIVDGNQIGQLTYKGETVPQGFSNLEKLTFKPANSSATYAMEPGDEFQFNLKDSSSNPITVFVPDQEVDGGEMICHAVDTGATQNACRSDNTTWQDQCSFVDPRAVCNTEADKASDKDEFAFLWSDTRPKDNDGYLDNLNKNSYASMWTGDGFSQADQDYVRAGGSASFLSPFKSDLNEVGQKCEVKNHSGKKREYQITRIQEGNSFLYACVKVKNAKFDNSGNVIGDFKIDSFAGPFLRVHKKYPGSSTVVRQRSGDGLGFNGNGAILTAEIAKEGYRLSSAIQKMTTVDRGPASQTINYALEFTPCPEQPDPYTGCSGDNCFHRIRKYGDKYVSCIGNGSKDSWKPENIPVTSTLFAVWGWKAGPDKVCEVSGGGGRILTQSILNRSSTPAAGSGQRSRSAE